MRASLHQKQSDPGVWKCPRFTVSVHLEGERRSRAAPRETSTTRSALRLPLCWESPAALAIDHIGRCVVDVENCGCKWWRRTGRDAPQMRSPNDDARAVDASDIGDTVVDGHSLPASAALDDDLPTDAVESLDGAGWLAGFAGSSRPRVCNGFGFT